MATRFTMERGCTFTTPDGHSIVLDPLGVTQPQRSSLSGSRDGRWSYNWAGADNRTDCGLQINTVSDRDRSVAITPIV